MPDFFAESVLICRAHAWLGEAITMYFALATGLRTVLWCFEDGGL